METCGISCILMLLDYYRRVTYPTAKQERKLYSLYRCRAFRGVTAAAAADCLSKNGLQVRLLHSFEAMMDNRDGYFPDDLYRAMLEEYRACIASCRDRISLETGADITCERLRSELSAGRQIMVQCIVPGNADGIHEETLHWILLYGFQNGYFLTCDPLSSKITLTEQELERYMDTPIGRICIVVEGG